MMKNSTLSFLKGIFVVAALWNLAGAGFGYFNTAYTFEGFFGTELEDPLMYEIYKGAWGTTLVYFFGYLIVGRNPVKHSGIVVVGAIGKLGFAIGLLKLFVAGTANAVVLIVVVGDFVFLLLFAYYFFQLYKARLRII